MGRFYKHIALLVYYILVSIGVQSQTHTIIGKIIDKETKHSIKDVVITVDKYNLWSISDKDGKYIIHNIPSGEYKLYFYYLGYKEETKEIQISDSSKIPTIELIKNTLALQEVIVNSQENKQIYTSSKMNDMSIRHIQASSLEDIMQLMPGSPTTNPSLKNPNFLSIREVIKETKKANAALSLGTAVIVDEMPLSNDANLQFLTSSNTQSSEVIYKEIGSTMAMGIDAREISPSNIESVEVIRGVASVAHGDMTSGVVIVKTKAGISPLNLSVKSDPYTKQISIGQGIGLNTKGVLNYDIDYTNYYKDLRSDSKTYKRINSQLRYSNTYFATSKPLTFNVKFDLSQSIDESQTDKDAVGDESYKYSSTRLGINIFGKGILDKKWISEYTYALNSNLSISETKIQKLVNLGGQSKAANSSTESGEYLVNKLPSEYYTNLLIDGKPLYVNAKISASLFSKNNKTYNKLLYGAEWKSTGNLGKGREFDYSKPFNPISTNSTRKRDYRDIPFLHNISIYLEDKISLTIQNSELTIQAGVRLNNLIASQGIDKDYKITYEPRVNIEYKFLDIFSLRAAYGINYKNPTLIHLYPDKVYFDKTSFDNKDIFVSTTKVLDDVSNKNLRPTKNIKKEIGLGIKADKVKIDITFFEEDLTDAISFATNYDIVTYNKYKVYNNTDKIEYINSQLRQNGLALNYDVLSDYNYYTKPNNTSSFIKRGIEYSFEFRKFESLNSSLSIDGAYFFNKETTDENYFAISQIDNKHDYVGLYPSGKGINSERLNTTFRLVSHFPNLRLVFSLSAQVTWLESYQHIYRSEHVQIEDDKIIINPVAYLNKDGKITKLESSELEREEFKSLIITDLSNIYRKESYPITSQLNLKLTKEIGDYADISFYVNNLFNYIQRVKLQYRDAYIYRNQPIFFGAMLKIKI